MTPILSIIIVNWNTCDLLVDCLQSIAHDLRDFHSGDVECFVVDNASTDESVPTVRAMFPWVKLICNIENTGFAAANNQAIELSQAAYVLLLNPDTRLIMGALKTLVEFMNANPQVGVAGPRLLNADGSMQPSCSPQPTLVRETWRLFHLDTLYPYSRYSTARMESQHPIPVDVVQGAALITRREVLKQVGWLDTDYFIYSEEVDFCFRVRQAGWTIFWVPRAEVIHYGGQSTQQVRSDMFLQLYLAKVQYFRKNHGVVTARMYKFILFMAALTRIVVGPLFLLLSPSQHTRVAPIASYYRRLLLMLPRF